MESLPMGVADHSKTKEKAIEDARKMQASIVMECDNTGKEPPSYTLSELIGKGSFGRVYKAVGTKSGQIVAVKIISIEEGDSFHPGANDTFGDILKEVNTLKLLNNGGARNINTILDTLLVSQSVWMVTEYCAGGSVATMMRPTGGLAEKWIIPILREVAEAIHWVHKQGIIHRDIKSANVLITETGGVQLCDFGVAGIIETRFDKRSTVTGTLQWMAPELFDSSVSYGMEVDIWAFGSMAFEVATGLPPNATNLVDISHFGSYLKRNCPRLEGDQYSSQLKDLVAFCMVPDPGQRPGIEHVQRHPYIFNSASAYPTASLSKLVSAYKLWEIQGGNRRSLFSAGGAQGQIHEPSPSPSDDEWNFGTMNEHQLTLDDPNAQAVYDVYGPRVDFPCRPLRQQPRRRPPNIRPLTAPLEKVFDPNTLTSYEDHARVFYGRLDLPKTSDLTLRDEPEGLTVRESLIDLDASLDGSELSRFADLETIRCSTRAFASPSADLDRRRTQDWTFPVTAPESMSPTISPPQPNEWTFPVMASQPVQSDISRSQANEDEELPTHQHGSSDGTAGLRSQDLQLNRASILSLIDLDASLPRYMPDTARPSTSGSDTISSSSDLGRTPFDLERHTLRSYSLQKFDREPSIYVPDDVGFGREPSIYVSDDFDSGENPYFYAPDNTEIDRNPLINVSGEASPLGQSHSVEATTARDDRPHELSKDTDMEFRFSTRCSGLAVPSIPAPPAQNVMLGTNSPEELKFELQRIISSLGEYLQFATDTLGELAVRRAEHDSMKNNVAHTQPMNK